LRRKRKPVRIEEIKKPGGRFAAECALAERVEDIEAGLIIGCISSTRTPLEAMLRALHQVAPPLKKSYERPRSKEDFMGEPIHGNLESAGSPKSSVFISVFGDYGGDR
jgi:hypothetical protein